MDQVCILLGWVRLCSPKHLCYLWTGLILLGIVLKIVLRKSLVCSCNRDNLSPLLLIMPRLLKGLSCLTGGNKSCFHPYEITGKYLLTVFLCICSHFQVKNFFMCAEIYIIQSKSQGAPFACLQSSLSMQLSHFWSSSLEMPVKSSGLPEL